jgi:hypothetical protein
MVDRRADPGSLGRRRRPRLRRTVLALASGLVVAPVQVSAISTKLIGATPQPTDGLARAPELWSLGE